MARRRASISSAERPPAGWASRGADACGAGASGRGRGFRSKAGCFSAGAPGVSVRRRLVSTTTVLDRPWLKLCRTVPVFTDPATRGFRVRGARPAPEGAPPAGLPSLSFASLIRSLYSSDGPRPAKTLVHPTNKSGTGVNRPARFELPRANSRVGAGETRRALCPLRSIARLVAPQGGRRVSHFPGPRPNPILRPKTRHRKGSDEGFSHPGRPPYGTASAARRLCCLWLRCFWCLFWFGLSFGFSCCLL